MTPVAGDTFVVERVPRAVFSLTGDRPLGYLHDVLAQDVAELTPVRGAIAAVLTPVGRVAAEVRVLPLGDMVLLDAEEAARPGIIEHIARHAPLAGCEVSDASERFAVAAVRGPKSDEVLAAAGAPVPGLDEGSIERERDVLFVRVRWGVAGVDLIGSANALDAFLASVDSPRGTIEQLEAARIRAGRPRFGVDVTEELLVNETPLLAHGVSMSKGCYPGQESVARIDNLGRIRRSLRSLRSKGTMAGGADVLAGDAVIGKVTSVAELPGGGSAAIALLASEAGPGALVRIEDQEAVVEALL